MNKAQLDDWKKNHRVAVMTRCVRAKFTQQPALAQALIDTGNALIEELPGAGGGDRFWEGCKGGQNQLGKIIMQVRRELREASAAAASSSSEEAKQQQSSSSS